VTVRAGLYPAQSLAGSKALPRVRFDLAPNAHFVDLSVHADNVEVRGGRIDDLSVNHDSSGFISRNTNRGVFSVWGARNVSFIGGDAGPSYDPGKTFRSSWISFDSIDGTNAVPRNVLIDGVYIHDYRKPSEDAHTQCIFIVGGQGITIRNSRFARCDVFDIYLGTPWFGTNLPPVTNLTIENNLFDEATIDGKYGGAYYSIRFAGDWPRLDNIRIAYNSAKQAMSLANPDTPRSNFVVEANAMPFPECFSGITYRYNVFTGGKCATTDKSVRSLGFTAANTMDLRLLRGSPAVDSGNPSDFPPRDIFGHRRPAGKAPDAGAVESR
jgi:hypothetical protein